MFNFEDDNIEEQLEDQVATLKAEKILWDLADTIWYNTDMPRKVVKDGNNFYFYYMDQPVFCYSPLTDRIKRCGQKVGTPFYIRLSTLSALSEDVRYRIDKNDFDII